MSKPRKSRATGEKVGWVSRKDGDAMAGAESGSRLFIFHGVQLSPGLLGLLGELRLFLLSQPSLPEKH